MINIEKTDNNKYDIIVPKEVQYIGRDWPNFELPLGQSILNKKLTGCGITEWAINCKKDIVLCSPRIMLLDNKYDQHLGEVCYIQSKEERVNPDGDLEKGDLEFPEKEEEDERTYTRIYKQVREYIEENDGIRPIKILVTYDSFMVLKLILSNLGCLDRFHIIIDEFQSLLVDSRFKSETELKFLKSLSSVRNVCYVSATPMIEEYIAEIPELCNLPYYNLNWIKENKGRVKKPRLKIRNSVSVNRTAGLIITPYLNNKFAKKYVKDKNTGELKLVESKEAVIFVNSVNNIISIIDKYKLKPDQVNILCAKTKGNQNKITKRLKNKKFVIGKIPLKGEPHKMFTFCTRTVYLGADFNSDNARTFIISDANIENLAVDISLDLPQILGRQRNENNPWRDEAMLYFKLLNETKKISQEEFKARLDEKIDSSKTALRIFNRAIEDNDPKAQIYLTKQVEMSLGNRYKQDYISLDKTDPNNPKPVINYLMMLAEKRAFEIQQIDFADRFGIFAGINSDIELDESYNKANDIMNEYEKLKTLYEKLKFLCMIKNNFEDEVFEIVLSQVMDKNFYEYFTILGAEIVKSSGYKTSELNNKLKALESFDEDNFKHLLDDNFKVGEKYLSSTVKTVLQSIYDKVGHPNKKAKSTDINNWFNTKEMVSTINGEKGRGYLIEGRRGFFRNPPTA